MASNEELAMLVQRGERDRLIELWQQVQRMALKRASSWAVYRSNGVELEDLEQAGFIALMRAVDSFDLNAGTRFSTWYYPIMKDEFERATGRRTEKQRRDPLNVAVSLDAPITENSDDFSLGDTIPDPKAEAAMLDVDRREYLHRLHAVLESAVKTLPPNLQAVVWRHYFHGEAVDNNAHSKAIRLLRHPKCSRALREYYQL